MRIILFSGGQETGQEAEECGRPGRRRRQAQSEAKAEAQEDRRPFQGPLQGQKEQSLRGAVRN